MSPPRICVAAGGLVLRQSSEHAPGKKQIKLLAIDYPADLPFVNTFAVAQLIQNTTLP
jgi:hypothetical protein